MGEKRAMERWLAEFQPKRREHVRKQLYCPSVCVCVCKKEGRHYSGGEEQVKEK
jgi:hypothetical protein